MEKRKFKGDEVSLLGFGCMRLPKLYEDKEDIDEVKAQEMVDYAYANGVNYYDTAYIYHAGMSENFIGKALKKYDRKSYYLADKLPTWEIKSKDDIHRIFDEQLKKCDVTYFDYYLVHSLNVERWDIVLKHDIYNILKQKQEAGQIKKLGFSFHDRYELFKIIVNTYDWEFVQIQMNYIDWDLLEAKEMYELLESKNIPAIVMEPVRGGSLATLNKKTCEILKAKNPDLSIASWAIRYCASYKNVLTVLSGMSNMEHAVDNVKSMTNFKPLNESELDVLKLAIDEFNKSSSIPCTGCRYCIECPKSVDIPKIFSLYNQKNYEDDWNFKMNYDLIEDHKKGKYCVSCNYCSKHCPQGIDIPKWLGEIENSIK